MAEKKIISIAQDSPLVPVLKETLESYNLTVSQSSDSSLCDLPPASLQRFLRGKNVTCTESSRFKGSILASFNQSFTNRYIGIHKTCPHALPILHTKLRVARYMDEAICLYVYSHFFVSFLQVLS